MPNSKPDLPKTLDTPHVDAQGAAPGESDITQTVRVAFEPSAVAEVRQVIVADLQARGIKEETIDEAELCASELVTNALRHARPMQDGTLRVFWKVKDPLVEIEVTDGGSDTRPVPSKVAPWRTSGRGLRIIRALAHEWGVNDARHGGVTVWVALGGPSRRRTS